MISKILNLNIGRYFVISCLISIIDFFISYISYRVFRVNYLSACNIGIVLGFIIQYFMCSKYVFKTKRFVGSFIIYLVTFLVGIFIADGTMWVCYDLLQFSFFISRTFSMAVPFFITYFSRKILFRLKNG